jgi:tetratricopeptide (TPR) repeat protein
MKRARFWLGVTALGGALALALSCAVPHGAATRLRAPNDTAITSHSIAFFEGRLARDPGNFMIAGQLVARYMLRFQVSANLADVRRAESLARSVLPLVSDTGGAYARLGAVYLTQHKFAPAYDAARRGVAWNPGNQGALGVLFDAAVATGRYAVAESTLTKLRRGRLPYQFRAAHMLSMQGRMDGAYHALDRACVLLARAAVRPQELAWCLTELAKIQLARDGEGERAAAALYGQALAVQPGYRAAVEGLADLAFARGDWREARDLFGPIAVDAHPDLYLRLAEVHQAIGEPEVAQRYERQFLAVARARDAEALYAHPLALYYASSPVTIDTALAIARRDVGRRPAIESYDVLSWVLFRRGDLVAALAASDQARRWGKPTPTMDFHRAQILAALGRNSEAAALLKPVLAQPSLLEPAAAWELRASRRVGVS